MLARGLPFECPEGCGSKMGKQTTYPHQKSGRFGFCSWLGKRPHAPSQGIERSRFVRELDQLRPDPAAAFDRLPDLEALDYAERVRGNLVERQQVPFAVQEAAHVEVGDSDELRPHLLGRDLDLRCTRSWRVRTLSTTLSFLSSRWACTAAEEVA